MLQEATLGLLFSMTIYFVECVVQLSFTKSIAHCILLVLRCKVCWQKVFRTGVTLTRVARTG